MGVLSSFLIYVAIALAPLLLFVYYKLKKNLRYFEDRKIPSVKAKNFLGSDPDGVLFRIHQSESWDRIYKEADGKKICGFYQTWLPLLMVRDPEYINQVLTSSFDHFFDRFFVIDEKTNPLDAHLFFLRGNKWRFLRNKLSPIFSSSKLKWMFQEMEKCGETFIESVDEIADGRDLDFYEQLARYATDVIGSCAFGLEGDSIKNPDSKFRQMGKEFFTDFVTQIYFLMRFMIPNVLLWLKIKSLPARVENYFISTMKQVMDHRKKTKLQRRDFVQLLLQLKEKGSVEIDVNEIEENNETQSEHSVETFEITDNLLVAQSFVFFLAGFETTATTLRYLTYCLAEHPDMQERARKEVQQVKEKYGQFTYEALKEMTFLDKCISESLRLYPPVFTINRECTKGFTFPDGTYIEKGTQILIPVLSVQRDPKYFPDPLKYDPDRFQDEPPRGTYVPFGDGPRMCIGKRFALTEVKIVLARLLERYKLLPSSLNKGNEIKIQPTAMLLSPEKGLWIRIQKLNE